MATKDSHENGSPASVAPTPEDARGPRPRFPVSSVPANPLGEGRSIRTAAALIIGDEILNGKTQDTNSHAFAQYCFQYGVDLKRIEVVADDEDEIVEAARRLCSKFDFVVTSGGIGPTHDDITYESLAKAFNTTVTHHEETIKRMTAMNKWRRGIASQSEEQRAASYRMALFPETAEVIFIDPEIWVPVVRLGGKLCVFPGIPALFQKMLHALTGFIPLPPPNERPLRIQIFTERPESSIAPYLTELQKRLKPHGVQVGSYPILYKGVFVSLIGRELPPTPVGTPISSSKRLPDSEGPSLASFIGPTGSTRGWLADVAKEVEDAVQGRVFTEEEVARHKEANANWNVRAGGKPSGQMEDLPKDSVEEAKEVKPNL